VSDPIYYGFVRARCGDCGHQKIDLKNFKGNKKNSGFLPEERAWMTRLLSEAGKVDVYRQLQPSTTDAAYTWLSNRGQAYAKNVGWRLDCLIASPSMAALTPKVEIFKEQRFSEHAPLIIDYELSL
jgi:exodeoxyribonuclease-3